MTQPLRGCCPASREYPCCDNHIRALRDVQCRHRGRRVRGGSGASGSGKSTLMNVLGCLDRPTTGSYEVEGRDTAGLEPDELAALRREHFGFIFQRYHLLSDLTAVENVEMPAIYAGVRAGQRHARSHALLTRLGIADRLDHRPTQLSGGQQQRVSIARALMNGGRIILADEPPARWTAVRAKRDEDPRRAARRRTHHHPRDPIWRLRACAADHRAA